MRPSRFGPDMVTTLCTRCKLVRDGFYRSVSGEVPFVCTECRCEYCHLVLDYVCSCGEVHGKRSAKNSNICQHCVEWRDVVSGMDESLKLLIKQDIESEEPIYK
jgi:hypothetical protein